MRRAERITPAVAYHGEGPFWDSRSGRLLFMNALAGSIIAVDGAGQLSCHQLPSQVSTVIRRRALGGFVIATERGLVLADDQLSMFEEIAQLSDDPLVRTNDGGCDRLGAFIIGTMSYDGRPGGGAVYRVTPDRRITEVLSPVSISNGLQWSADGTRVYYIDSPTRRVDVFNVHPDTGDWSDRRAHIHIGAELGLPDGMAIDVEGGLWVALWGGGAINHYDASARLVETILVPGVTQVSSCAFGGDDRSVLYITTSRQGLPQDSEPDAGAVFAIQTRLQGAILSQFDG